LLFEGRLTFHNGARRRNNHEFFIKRKIKVKFAAGATFRISDFVVVFVEEAIECEFGIYYVVIEDLE